MTNLAFPLIMLIQVYLAYRLWSYHEGKWPKRLVLIVLFYNLVIALLYLMWVFDLIR